MIKDNVQEQLELIISDIAITLDPSSSELETDTQLKIILSESTHALKLLTIIEDEFQIEISDDQITLDFFSSINNIIKVVCSHL